MRHTPLCLAAGVATALAACNHPTAGGFPPAGLEIIAGDSQVRSAGQAVRYLPTVRVTDADGAPLPGVPVTFAGVRTAEVSPPVVVTDQDGLAALPHWALRSDGGEDTLVAKVDGVGSATFLATSLVVTDLSVGESNTCVLMTGGRAYCWGANSYGQLATGDTMDVPRPRRVAAGLRFQSISAGGFQTCGLGLDQLIYCAGSVSRWPSLTLDMTESGGGRQFRQIWAGNGGGPRCGIGDDLSGYCWGSDIVYPDSNGGWGYWPETPLKLPGGANAGLRQIVTNLSRTAIPEPSVSACVLDAAGQIQCWTMWQFASMWGASPPGASFEALSSGGMHVCGLHRNQVSCWWYYDRTPVTMALPPVRAMSSGSFLTCALGVTGGVYCWMIGGTPAVVSGTAQRRYTRISVSDGHTCALDEDGGLWCWGRNDRRQLGDGTTTDSPTPIRVKLDF